MIRINLLPVLAQRRLQALFQFLALSGAALLGLLFVLVFTWGMVKGDVRKLESENERLRNDIETFKRIIKEIDGYETVIAELRQKKDVIERLRANRQGPVRVLDELATRLPKKVWLQEMVRQGNRLQLKGGALSQRDIAAFMLALEESEYISNVQLQQIAKPEGRRDEEPIQEFQISAQVVTPAADKPSAGGADGEGAGR